MKRDPQINIRMPSLLKELIHEEARINNRSVNSEIVGMLSEMVRLRSPNRDLLITAEQANLLMDGIGFDASIKSTLSNCAAAINASVSTGSYRARVRHYFGNGEEAEKYLTPVKQKLEDIGYDVEFEKEDILIHIRKPKTSLKSLDTGSN